MRALALSLCMLIASCASTPPSSPRENGNSRSDAAGYALKMVGKPYHFGGASPSGFDCSGLVQFSYRQVGVSLPHNTEQQRRSGQPVKRAELRRGDLVFFDQEGKKHSHVGIYLGGGRFVHAPSSGKQVRTDRLDSPYWKKHISDTRRIAA